MADRLQPISQTENCHSKGARGLEPGNDGQVLSDIVASRSNPHGLGDASELSNNVKPKNEVPGGVMRHSRYTLYISPRRSSITIHSALARVHVHSSKSKSYDAMDNPYQLCEPRLISRYIPITYLQQNTRLKFA